MPPQWIKLAEMTHTAHQIIQRGFTVQIHWQRQRIHVSAAAGYYWYINLLLGRRVMISH